MWIVSLTLVSIICKYFVTTFQVPPPMFFRTGSNVSSDISLKCFLSCHRGPRLYHITKIGVLTNTCQLSGINPLSATLLGSCKKWKTVLFQPRPAGIDSQTRIVGGNIHPSPPPPLSPEPRVAEGRSRWRSKALTKTMLISA